MNKLESIKDDLKLFNTTTEANIEYLLQRLERYEKALKHYAKVDNWYPDDYKGTQIFIWDDNTKPWEVAKQALDQLKE